MVLQKSEWLLARLLYAPLAFTRVKETLSEDLLQGMQTVLTDVFSDHLIEMKPRVKYKPAS